MNEKNHFPDLPANQYFTGLASAIFPAGEKGS
jgi:hypothetical protein